MLIIHHIDQIKEHFTSLPDIGITIGNFDGVHLGHRALLGHIKKECLEKNYQFVVVTFVPHPQKIIHPEKAHFLINSYEDRKKLLSMAGVDILIEMDFSRDFSTLSPNIFLQNHLLSYPHLKKFFLGYDFAFGSNKSGGHDLIIEYCQPRGIDVEVQSPFKLQEKVISSSMIRDQLSKGEMKKLSANLGRPFHLNGVVVKGEGRGKKIGFPTANIQMEQDIVIPQKGVYVTKTSYGGMLYKSITNIGSNPTFKNSESISVETNIFDFNVDIYGESLLIEFYEKIRDEQKFPTVNDLVNQINLDVSHAKEFWNLS